MGATNIQDAKSKHQTGAFHLLHADKLQSSSRVRV